MNLSKSHSKPETAPSTQSLRKHVVVVASLAFIASVLWSAPAMAQSLDPLENMADEVVDFILGPFLTSLATIVVAGVGIACWRGRIAWGWLGAALLGAVIAFGAPEIVDWISSAL